MFARMEKRCHMLKEMTEKTQYQERQPALEQLGPLHLVQKRMLPLGCQKGKRLFFALMNIRPIRVSRDGGWCRGQNRTELVEQAEVLSRFFTNFERFL